MRRLSHLGTCEHSKQVSFRPWQCDKHAGDGENKFQADETVCLRETFLVLLLGISGKLCELALGSELFFLAHGSNIRFHFGSCVKVESNAKNDLAFQGGK